jgi:hypothetical protein
MDGLPTLMQSVRENPGDKAGWLALSFWMWSDGREDEAAVLRVLWPTLRDHMAQDRWSLEATLADVAENAKVLARVARQIEARASEGPDDRWPTE